MNYDLKRPKIKILQIHKRLTVLDNGFDRLSYQHILIYLLIYKIIALDIIVTFTEIIP